MATVAIEAGRDLDALVAVEVMGWKQVGARWWVRLDGVSVPHPPTFSTTGDGMLAVLERMRALGWEWEISEVSFGPVGAEHTQYTRAWSASIEAFSDEDERFFVHQADTLPHVVCLAALEAVRARAAREEVQGG